MHRALLLMLAVVGSFAGCSRCSGDSPGKQPSDTQLTEKNTSIPADRLVHGRDGGAWTLTMPDRDWRLVNADARDRLRPDIDVWVVNPIRDAYLTVQCVNNRKSTQLEPAVKVAAERAGRTFTQTARETLEGPWVNGVELSYSTAAAKKTWVHVEGFFDLVGQTCDVQTWASDAVQLPELRRVVRSFSPSLTPSELALVGPAHAMTTPKVQARVAVMLDAGIPAEQVPMLLVARGLPRLPDAEVDERFDMRRQLVEQLPDDVCWAVVSHSNDPGLLIALLDQLGPAKATRWGELSVNAINAEVDNVAAVPLDRTELGEAQRAWLAIDGVRDAELLLKHGDTVSPGGVCHAEKVRLAAAFSLDRATRVKLFRSWLSAQ